MPYGIGHKALKRLCKEQDIDAWLKADLSPELFPAQAQPAFVWMDNHVKQHHALPAIETLLATFPDLIEFETPEPASFYLDIVEKAYAYREISSANLDSQNILKLDQAAHENALERMRLADANITRRKYRRRIIDVGGEGADLVLKAYHAPAPDSASIFGWPFLDNQTSGVRKGEMVSIVGRPSVGKTFLGLYIALTNWTKGNNVLFVSMEMAVEPILDRIASMYTHTPISQLTSKGFSNWLIPSTLDKFTKGIASMKNETSKLWLVGGELAASVEEIYIIADRYKCETVIIDGAYLVRHKNHALDRYARIAENVELMKRYTTNLGAATFASWQFNRDASKKIAKKSEVSIDEIGYSDAIGQISSIVCCVLADAEEASSRREIRVLKGRNGESGQFSVAWNFLTMDFSQVDPEMKPVD